MKLTQLKKITSGLAGNELKAGLNVSINNFSVNSDQLVIKKKKDEKFCDFKQVR